MNIINHLHALELRLSNERNRLNNAKTENERNLRNVWVKQIEKEIANEIKFDQITIDDLANELKDFC